MKRVLVLALGLACVLAIAGAASAQCPNGRCPAPPITVPPGTADVAPGPGCCPGCPCPQMQSPRGDCGDGGCAPSMPSDRATRGGPVRRAAAAIAGMIQDRPRLFARSRCR